MSHTVSRRSSPKPSWRIALSARTNDRRLRRRLAAAVHAALASHRCPRATLSVAVVDDGVITDLHARYRGIREPTDVLAFDLSDAPGDGAVDGEIVVSEDTARREATRRGLPFEEELARYVIHGALHLLGHSDDTPAGAEAMHRIEDELLGQRVRAVRRPRRRRAPPARAARKR